MKEKVGNLIYRYIPVPHHFLPDDDHQTKHANGETGIVVLSLSIFSRFPSVALDVFSFVGICVFPASTSSLSVPLNGRKESNDLPPFHYILPPYSTMTSIRSNGRRSFSIGSRMSARLILLSSVAVLALSVTTVCGFALPAPSIGMGLRQQQQHPDHPDGSLSQTRSRLSVSTTTSDNVSTENMPELGSDGVYHILNEDQHK